jgi:uroporphyrinogen-III synthase
MTSLSGKRILITRPRDRANTFAAALQAQGAQPVYFPTIQIVPVEDTTCLDRALTHLDKYDWLVLTSANAVEAVHERLNALEIQPASPPLKVAAIGPKTAAALEARGVSPDFMPSEHISEAILPGLGELQEKWVLLPLADIAHEGLPKAIQDAGGVSHVVTAYHNTVPAAPDPEGLANIQAGVDVITFTSGSTAHNFVALTQNGGLDPFHLPGNPIVACIGPKTAQAARQAGFTVDIVAEEYTTEGLVETLTRNLESL